MAKVVLYSILLMQIYISQGLWDEGVTGQTEPFNKDELNYAHPVFDKPVSVGKNSEASANQPIIKNVEAVFKLEKPGEKLSEVTPVTLDTNEHIKRQLLPNEEDSLKMKQSVENITETIVELSPNKPTMQEAEETIDGNATLAKNKENTCEINEFAEELNETTANNADEQIKRIQQASETIATVIQNEFDNLVKMIQNPKRSRRDTTFLPNTKYFTKFLNYMQAQNDQQNNINDKSMSNEELAQKYGVLNPIIPTIESNEVEENTDIQASDNVEPTVELEVQIVNPTETNIELPHSTHIESTPAPYTNDPNYYHYDTSTETTSEPTVAEDTSEQPQIYHISQDPSQDTSDRSNTFVPHTANEYTTVAYPEQEVKPYMAPIQDQIVYMMQPQQPMIISDMVEKKLETDFSTVNGEQPKMSHQTYSTKHKISQIPASAYYHTMQQNMPYYYALP